MTVSKPRKRFEQWQSLAQFRKDVESLRPAIGDYRSRRYKFWREAWVAAEFAHRSGQSVVCLRLLPEDSPEGDFQILGDDRVCRNFEVTEALDSSMPPALKNLRAAGGEIYHEQEDAVSGALARKQIRRLVELKAKKTCYPAGTTLVIYVNLWSDFDKAGPDGLLPETEIAFASIWLLADGLAIQIFPR
jgi:hypothetical protein